MSKGAPNKNKRTEFIMNSVLLAPERGPPLVEIYNWLRKVLLAVPTGLETATRNYLVLGDGLLLHYYSKGQGCSIRFSVAEFCNISYFASIDSAHRPTGNQYLFGLSA